jgi:hypothetical protein
MFKRSVCTVLLALLPVLSPAEPFWGARESRPVETAPADLKPGEFVWNAAAPPPGRGPSSCW